MEKRQSNIRKSRCLLAEVSDLANEILKTRPVTPFEAFEIAVKIQHNRILEDVLPSALEAQT